MNKENAFSNIVPIFDFPIEYSNSLLYKDVIKNTLKKILPNRLFNEFDERERCEDLKLHMDEMLPLITSVPGVVYCDEVPCHMSFFVFSKYRSNAFKFFFEMISRWLVPGKRLNVVLIYAADFRLPTLSNDAYTVCEVMLKIEEKEELEEIQRNLPIIETELRLGMGSSYYARRILEIKGLLADEKTVAIHENIAYLLNRLPNFFQHDILSETQHVLVMCRDDFKASRGCRHMSRIICFHYLFRKSIRDALKKSPKKRHLHVKLFKSKVNLQGEKRVVLGVVVGINFLSDKEVFEERHLLTAIQHYVPTAKSLENSFFVNRRGSEDIASLYLEVEKSDGSQFTTEEIRVLQRQLGDDLKDRIEPLMHPVFMPCNEEEIMRNILSLSNQIKYLRDIPQVFISFDRQSYTDLFFTIILVRVIKPESVKIDEMFKRSHTYLEYIHDRCKTVGYLRRKYAKEATVFRVRLRKEQFLRKDHSIDLYKARQAVVTELNRVVGEVRDYNGGMISKQNELLSALRELLENEVDYDELLLENFFYSLNPVIMRTVLDPEALKTLFLMLHTTLQKGFVGEEKFALNIRVEPNYAYVMITSEELSFKDEIAQAINKFHLHSTELATAFVKTYGIRGIGYIYRCDDALKQREFCQTIQDCVDSLAQKAEEEAVVVS